MIYHVFRLVVLVDQLVGRSNENARVNGRLVGQVVRGDPVLRPEVRLDRFPEVQGELLRQARDLRHRGPRPHGGCDTPPGSQGLVLRPDPEVQLGIVRGLAGTPRPVFCEMHRNLALDFILDAPAGSLGVEGDFRDRPIQWFGIGCGVTERLSSGDFLR